jgi:hypothetical protein
VPLPVAGQPVAGAGGRGFVAATTKAVGTDVAVVVPSPFLASTLNLIVLPTSPETSVYFSEWAL